MIRKAKKQLRDDPGIELHPDGWERFRSAVVAAAKSGPKHRLGKDKLKEPAAEKPNN